VLLSVAVATLVPFSTTAAASGFDVEQDANADSRPLIDGEAV